MTDEQKAALEWLDQFTATAGWRHQVRTLKAMLAEPRLPKEPPHEALVAMAHTQHGALYLYQWEEAYNALFAYLTKPATKEVEVWHVEWAALSDGGGRYPAGQWYPVLSICPSEDEARKFAASINRDEYRCIRVTGPHKQEVPA